MTHKLTIQVKYHLDRQEVIETLIAEASYYGIDSVLDITSRPALMTYIRQTLKHFGEGMGRVDELDESCGEDEAAVVRQKIADLVDRLLPELKD